MAGTLTSTVSIKPFKRCSKCRVVWNTPADFMKDTGVRSIGHQESAMAGDPGVTLFNHSCGTTLSIKEERANAS